MRNLSIDGGGLSAFADGPDDEALATPDVAGGEDVALAL